MWIEIQPSRKHVLYCVVTSLAEVWIEIYPHTRQSHHVCLSLPLRKCGLKYMKHFNAPTNCCVTSLAEVWIEICLRVTTVFHDYTVTSLAEVWIEIFANGKIHVFANGHFPCGSVD